VSAHEVSYSDGFYSSNDGLALYYRLYTPSLPDIKSSASVSSRLKSEGSGSRKTILCLPGVSRNHRDFLPLIGQLPASVNWLLVDLRGRGHSAHDPNPANYNPATYVADICRLLDHLDLESVDIVGTSLGGILTMMLNAQHPQRVGRVVLNDIGAFVEREAVANIGSYLRQAHQHTSWDSVVTAIKPVYSDFFTDLTEDDWYALARRLYRQRPDATFVPDYDPALFSNSEAADIDLWPFFDTLKGKPTLVIRGANSGLLTPPILAQMTASRSDLRTATVPNRGHAPFLDEPSAVAAISAFFAIA
jgi:pimeloyl-ACP methyl ester carboxylesterase